MAVSTNEQWLPIVGYPAYEVSSIGGVRSVTRQVPWGFNRWGQQIFSTLKGQMIKTRLHHGYPTFGVCVNGKHRDMTVHMAMMQAFVGPVPKGQEVRHLDGKPANNVLSNLEYGTH